MNLLGNHTSCSHYGWMTCNRAHTMAYWWWTLTVL